jgi:hypothetical protein
MPEEGKSAGKDGKGGWDGSGTTCVPDAEVMGWKKCVCGPALLLPWPFSACLLPVFRLATFLSVQSQGVVVRPGRDA